ncbi:restriction endonuclease subunit S [Streptococcus sp. 27098_8_86]|uniref:restriction endonuclease subunit S n=1 Tax=Streptococcus sp. 27098_8_86 TaxID=3003670 RepID=UPI00352F1927
MTNSKHIPKRRFKEFESDSDWEEQTLTDFIKLYNGLTYSPNDVRKNGTLVLRSSNIQSGEIINADNVYVASDKATSENVKSGDIIVVVRNGSRSLIGKHAMVKGEMPNTVIGAFMSGMHSEHSTFVNALLDTPKFGKEIEKNMGATINQITGAMFSKMNFKIPSGIEQDYIGRFFYSIDSLITLHQHKLDKLKNLKKSYLAELFPAEGERVPKRRFPGFEGEWEIRKLKELTEYRRGSFPQPYGKNEWYGGIGSMPFVQVVDVLSNLKLAETTKQQISKLAQNQSVFVPQGTVVITLQGSIGRVAITQYDSYVDRTLLIFEKFLFPTDIYYWALSMQQKFDIESKKAPGGTIKTITKEALSEFEIFLPTLEEQKQIGEFFQKLDKSISLQQEKLNKLKDLKKAYLNELFV